MSRYYILTPPPNLTGLFHIGHTLNLIIQEFLKEYVKFMYNYELDSIFGFDHAALYAEIIAKQSLNVISRENILMKIKSNEIMFKSNILLQIREMGIKNINDNRELFTYSSCASEIVNKYFNDLIREKLIFLKKVCFIDTNLKTTLSDIEVKDEVSKSNLYYIKYYLENNKTDFLVVATTRPETIEADVCLVFSDKDERYERFFNKNVINPISGKLIKILKSKYVNKDFGTGLVKVTPDFSIIDEKILEELNLDTSNIPSIYDFNTLKFNKNSLFYDNYIFNSINIVVDFLNKNNYIFKIVPHLTNTFVSIRDNSPVSQIAIPQYFLDMPSILHKVKENINSINIIGCKGLYDIKQFTINLKPWCISRQNVYGHVIDKENVLDTWFSSSLYIAIAVKTLDLDLKITRFIVITAYDIMFFWIYRMFYNSQYFLKNQILKYVIVHGILCDNKGFKISKSKSNAKYIKFNNLEEFEKHKLFILCHNLFLKKIYLDESKSVYINRFLSKFKNLIKFFIKYNLVITNVNNIITNDPIIFYFLSKLLNIFFYRKFLTIEEIISNVEYIFSSVPKLLDFVMKDISINLINLINKDLNNIDFTIKYNISSLFSLISCFIKVIIPNIYNSISSNLSYCNDFVVLDFINLINKFNLQIYSYEIIKILDLVIPIFSDKKYKTEFEDLIGFSGSNIVLSNLNKYNIYFEIKNHNVKFRIYFNSNKIKDIKCSRLNNVLRYIKNCSSLKCMNI